MKKTLKILASVLFLLSAFLVTAALLPENFTGFLIPKGVAVQTVQSMPEGFDWENAPVRVHFIDVGQGDAILIESFGAFVLIDGGDNGAEETLLSYLNAQKVDKLRAVIATHLHNDHLGGLPEVLEQIPTEELMLTLTPEQLLPETRTYANFLWAMKTAAPKITEGSAGVVLDLGNDVVLTVLSPFEKEGENLNETSIICRLTYGETAFFFAADGEIFNEEKLLAAYSPGQLKSNVLKLGHHGSTTSNTTEFLQAVSPEIAVATVGENNDFGHPHKPVLERLSQRNIPLYRTDENGTVVIASDGKRVAVKTAS